MSNIIYIHAYNMYKQIYIVLTLSLWGCKICLTSRLFSMLVSFNLTTQWSVNNCDNSNEVEPLHYVCWCWWSVGRLAGRLCIHSTGALCHMEVLLHVLIKKKSTNTKKMKVVNTVCNGLFGTTF